MIWLIRIVSFCLLVSNGFAQERLEMPAEQAAAYRIWDQQIVDLMDSLGMITSSDQRPFEMIRAAEEYNRAQSEIESDLDFWLEQREFQHGAVIAQLEEITNGPTIPINGQQEQIVVLIDQASQYVAAMNDHLSITNNYYRTIASGGPPVIEPVLASSILLNAHMAAINSFRYDISAFAGPVDHPDFYLYVATSANARATALTYEQMRYRFNGEPSAIAAGQFPESVEAELERARRAIASGTRQVETNNQRAASNPAYSPADISTVDAFYASYADTFDNEARHASAIEAWLAIASTATPGEFFAYSARLAEFQQNLQRQDAARAQMTNQIQY